MRIGWRWRRSRKRTRVRGGEANRVQRVRCTWKAFGIFYFRFAFLAFWLTDSLKHWHPALPLPRGMAWYILNIVPCKDGARWHYFDIYLHLAAASFSPFCISNDPQLSFVDWLCSLSVPLFLPSFVSCVLLLCAAMRSRKAKLIFSPHIQHILAMVLYMMYTYICFIYIHSLCTCRACYSVLLDYYAINICSLQLSLSLSHDYIEVTSTALNSTPKTRTPKAIYSSRLGRNLYNFN